MSLATVLLSGCVPMSQFTEVRDDRDLLDQDVATLTEQVQELRLAVSEKTAKREKMSAAWQRSGRTLRLGAASSGNAKCATVSWKT